MQSDSPSQVELQYINLTLFGLLVDGSWWLPATCCRESLQATGKLCVINGRMQYVYVHKSPCLWCGLCSLCPLCPGCWPCLTQSLKMTQLPSMHYCMLGAHSLAALVMKQRCTPVLVAGCFEHHQNHRASLCLPACSDTIKTAQYKIHANSYMQNQQIPCITDLVCLRK